MQKTKIDWGIPNLWTWNPVTGCKRGCPYCYAKGIYDHFHKKRIGHPFTDIVFHENRLAGLKKLKPDEGHCGPWPVVGVIT